MEKFKQFLSNLRARRQQKKIRDAQKPAWRQWGEALLIAGVVAFLIRATIFGLYYVPTGSAIPTVLNGDRVWANKLAYAFGNKVQRGDIIVFDDAAFKFDRSSKIKYWWQKYVGFPIPFLGLPAGPINVTKRVIAIPGDWIEGRIENGKPVIYLNHKKLEEPYINPYPLVWLKKMAGFIDAKSFGPIPVPNFLRKHIVRDGVYYAYDPRKPFSKQPYFNMEPSEVLCIPKYPELTFRYPHTPSYKDRIEKTDCADVFGPIRVPEGKYWVMGDNRKDSMDSRWFDFLDEDRIQGRMSFIIMSIDSEESAWIFELLKHPIDFWIKSVRWNRFFKKPTAVTAEERALSIPERSVLLQKILREAHQDK